MSWHYKPPSTFPALFTSALRKALISPTILTASPNHKILEAIAENFRWFKWCVKQKPEDSRELYEIISLYDIRTSIEKDIIGYILFLTIRPTKISEFQRLNPLLASELFHECQ